MDQTWWSGVNDSCSTAGCESGAQDATCTPYVILIQTKKLFLKASEAINYHMSPARFQQHNLSLITVPNAMSIGR